MDVDVKLSVVRKQLSAVSRVVYSAGQRISLDTFLYRLLRRNLAVYTLTYKFLLECK